MFLELVLSAGCHCRITAAEGMGACVPALSQETEAHEGWYWRRVELQGHFVVLMNVKLTRLERLPKCLTIFFPLPTPDAYATPAGHPVREFGGPHEAPADSACSPDQSCK